MRYLLSAEDDELFAYAPGRRDFFKAGDDRLWAHESHGWLIAADSGETLAHRTGDVYYGAVDGERLYRLSAEPAGAAAEPAAAVAAPGGAKVVADKGARARLSAPRITRPHR